MKALILVAAFALIGCGHATTEMDRELALKLADKTPVIVQSAPPVVNVNVTNGSVERGTASERAELERLEREYAEHQAAQGYTPDRERPGDVSSHCMDSPIYDYRGNLTGYRRKCFGSR